MGCRVNATKRLLSTGGTIGLSIPCVQARAENYKDQGLVVIGVHAPELAFERNTDNVKKAVADLHIG
jgi:hypothetical protein